MTNSGPHKVYVILADPVLPWVNSTINNYNVWIEALDFAIDSAGCRGQTTSANALKQITQHLFDGHGVSYDTVSGKCSYVSIPYPLRFTIDLTEYMRKTRGSVVNCYDQAVAVAILGRGLGVSANINYMEPFGYINIIDLVGVGYCNNPFYDDADIVQHFRIVDMDSVFPNRSFFGNHAFVTFNGMVFDACAGPTKGNRTIDQYISDTIDTSTPAEASSAGNFVDVHGCSLQIRH